MKRWQRAGVTSLLATALSGASAIVVRAGDPAVPPGRDGGGIAVAIIGNGIDYTVDAVARRLARDGEGEITGYDYVDDDRQPFARNNLGQDMAGIVIGKGQTASLVVLRADAEDVISFSRALLYAGKSPARIILLEGTPRDYKSIRALVSAARYFHDRLFVLAAGDQHRDLDHDGASALGAMANVVIVAGAAADGTPLPGANTGALTIDLAAPAGTLDGENSGLVSGAASQRAAAHVAALAARLRAVEPAIPATAMKIRITDLARPVALPGGIVTRNGMIERPDRYFWLE